MNTKPSAKVQLPLAMSSTLPKPFKFKVLSFCLSIASFEVSNVKLLPILAVNLAILSVEITIQSVFRKKIFAYAGQPVLMVLDCVAIIGPLLVHVLLILESLIKKKTDFLIWTVIDQINDKMQSNPKSLQKTFQKDFFTLTLVPPLVYLAVGFATYRTQKNWALGIISNQLSRLVYLWGILTFVFYLRYISDKFSAMAQEIEHLCELANIYKYATNMIIGRIGQMKNNFNLVWQLHGLIKNRYQIFLVSYVFLSICGLTTSMYFLGTRLVTRKLSYAIESALCLVPYLYINTHISGVSSDFGLKIDQLLNALQSLSDQHWSSPKIVCAVKSFKIQIISANLSSVVGGHLKIEYSSIILGIVTIVTTNVFIFLFLN